MGSKVSKPARKLAGSVGSNDHLAKVSRSRVQLPSAELKARTQSPSANTQSSSTDTFAATPENEQDVNNGKEIKTNGINRDLQTTNSINNSQTVPEGKDGMDPQADQKYIDLITNLGRQIHSKNVDVNAPQADVTALKQLLNRKRLHLVGQSEAQAHMDSVTSGDSTGGAYGVGSAGSSDGNDFVARGRTVINPKTLTAIIDAINAPQSTKEDVAQDFQLLATFLNNLERFKVAHNVVMIEEHADEDQIGPIKGNRPKRETSFEESPNVYSDDARVKELQKRLE